MLKVHAKKLHAVELLCLEGQIIQGDTEILRSAVQWASDSRGIIFDLANVRNVDAHGLGVLLQLREQAMAKGIHFELMNVNKRLYRIFEMTRLNTVFEINREVEVFPKVVFAEQLLAA